MELINRIRKNRKGFTLVEIIVVLVILAILAAFTIPTMLGFVSDARGKALITEAREVKMAAQMTATEFIGSGRPCGATDLGSAELAKVGTTIKETGKPDVTYAGSAATNQMITYLTKDITPVGTKELSTSTAAFWTVALGNDKNSAQVTSIVYTKDGYTVTLEASGTTVVKNP